MHALPQPWLYWNGMLDVAIETAGILQGFHRHVVLFVDPISKTNKVKPQDQLGGHRIPLIQYG